MSKSIIVLDTNILTKSPFLNSGEWADLHARVDDWRLRFVVPEVVLMETVNVVRRNWRLSRDRLEQFAGWVHGFGMREELEAILAAADNRDADYEVSLRSRIDELVVEIVPLPATIDHLGIARRASERRAPYGTVGKPVDGHAKDGYRDTLIWLTVLEVAENHPGCDVWFVSNNYSDFGAKLDTKDPRDTAEYPLAWHSELAPELDEMGLAGRVLYARSLSRLEQHLLSTFSPLSAVDRDELWGAVDRSELDQHMTQALFATSVDPRSAALPLDTAIAMVTAAVPASDDVRLSEAARRAAGAWTARFTCEVKATIEVTRRSGDVVEEEKQLILSGRIDLTADSHVSALTVESIKTKADDPQHRAWERADASAQVIDQLNNLIVGQNFREQLNSAVIGTNWNKQLNRAVLGTNWSEQLNSAVLGTNWSEQLNSAVLGTNWSEQLNRAVLGTNWSEQLNSAVLGTNWSEQLNSAVLGTNWSEQLNSAVLGTNLSDYVNDVTAGTNLPDQLEGSALPTKGDVVAEEDPDPSIEQTEPDK